MENGRNVNAAFRRYHRPTHFVWSRGDKETRTAESFPSYLLYVVHCSTASQTIMTHVLKATGTETHLDVQPPLRLGKLNVAETKIFHISGEKIFALNSLGLS